MPIEVAARYIIHTLSDQNLYTSTISNMLLLHENQEFKWHGCGYESAISMFGDNENFAFQRNRAIKSCHIQATCVYVYAHILKTKIQSHIYRNDPAYAHILKTKIQSHIYRNDPARLPM